MCDLENLKNEEAMTRVGSQRHSKKKSYVIQRNALSVSLKKSFSTTLNSGMGISNAHGQSFKKIPACARGAVVGCARVGDSNKLFI